MAAQDFLLERWFPDSRVRYGCLMDDGSRDFASGKEPSGWKRDGAARVLCFSLIWMHRLSPLLPLLPLVAILGCASPGPPHPPSLHLPEPATGVTAKRVGREVRVFWTNPLNTTDGDRIKDGMTAVVCRELPSRSGCTPVQKVPVVAGSSTVTDVLPADLSSGPPRLLVYRVELLNGRGHSAGPSDPAFAAAGVAPPPTGPLTLSARRNAVLIRWPPVATPASAVMELTRTLVATADGPKPAAPDRTAKREGSLRAPKPPAGEATLRSTPGADSTGVDGLLDPTVTSADTYAYVAQWVMDVTISGHALELRGVPSPRASLTFRDVFPPAAPTGLVAVPGEGFGAPLSIDLSWEPNAETDLLGYNVYRRTGQGEFLRINADPVPASAYRDGKIRAGQSYTYRITAVDQRRNESAAGTEVQETPRP